MSSARSEETKTIQVHPEPRLESILPLVEVSDRVDGYSGRRDEEVRRIQAMADLGPRRTRSRGVQDVTADKSEVGPATRGPRGSGRVRPSVSSMTSPGVSVVLVMLCWIFHVARTGTSLADGISCDITNGFEDYLYMMYLFALWHCIPSPVGDIEPGQSQYLYVYICNIVPRQLTIFVLELMIVFCMFLH